MRSTLPNSGPSLSTANITDVQTQESATTRTERIKRHATTRRKTRLEKKQEVERLLKGFEAGLEPFLRGEMAPTFTQYIYEIEFLIVWVKMNSAVESNSAAIWNVLG